MPDIRSKVAYERAALLLQTEADVHKHENFFACEYCGGSWIVQSGHEGCLTRRTLLSLIDTLRDYKRNA